MNIFCDKCPCVENYGNRGNLEEAVKEARAAGWLIKCDNKDKIKHLCPACYKKES